MKKILFIFIVLISFSKIIYSVPAYPGLINFAQPDGSKLDIYLKGDEKVKWAETIDGYSILFDEKGFYVYAIDNQFGEMLPSGIIAHNLEDRTLQEISLLKTVKKNLKYSKSQVAMMKQIWEIRKKEKTKSFPTTGDRNLICILIGFTDLPFTKTQTDFNSLFNQLNYSYDGANGSVKDFFLEASYDQLNLTITVAGPYTASHTMSYYGANDASGYDVLPDELVEEAVTLANPDVNYSDFDNDNDGNVDGVYVIYAGYGEEAGGGSNAIWAHAWEIYPALTLDGKTISTYSCSAEFRNSSGGNITRIGVICHEFGHVLGAPDFYDTDYEDNGGDFWGTADWDLQAGGSWNGSSWDTNGAYPAHPNAYTKCYIYNWATPTVISTQQQLSLQNSTQNSGHFYRYNTTTSNEYFLMENRQQVGFDSYVPGHGLLIYHVDGDWVNDYFNSNDINVSSHQGLYPVCASATSNPSSTVSSYGSINSGGCPFPGTSNKTSFTDATIPNSKSWAGANTEMPITDISENSGVISLCFISCAAPCTPPTTQATGFSATNLADNSMTINWNRGNGNEVLVLAKSGSAVNANPNSGTSYTANTAFGSGNEIGTGNYVVYKGSGTTANITNFQSGTTYYYAIYEFYTADNCYKTPGLTGNATTTGTPPCSYCESFGNTTYETSTTLVQFSTINNSSAKPSGYSDYTSISTNVERSSNYNLTIKVNTDGDYDVNTKVWFDWNQDCDFDDAGETYDLGTATNVSNGSTSLSPKSILIPASANLGSTRMRVSTRYGSTSPTSCSTNFDGEVEDYTINVIDGTTAPSITVLPTSLIFDNQEVNTTSPEKTYTVAGSDLTENITITAPTGFEISTTSGTNFSNSLTLTQTSGNVSTTTIYVRFSPTLEQTYSGNIVNESLGASSQNVSVSGTGVNSSEPTITVNPVSIDFEGVQINQNSPEKTYTVAGSDLTENITITAPTGFEISTTSGTNFSNSLTLTQTSGNVSTTTIYVRFSPTLEQTYSGNIVNESLGAASQNVSVAGNGTVAPVPTITISPLQLNFGECFINSYSSELTLTVSGVDLSENLEIISSSDFEISLSSETNFSNSITISQVGGTIEETTIFVRFYPTANQNYTGTITTYCPGATQQTVNLSGIGVAELLPTVSISTTELAFGECNIDTYSTEQTFTVSGENLTENLDITSSDNFEISLSTEIDFSNSLTISHIAGTIEETTVYVRFLPTESQNYTGTISINSIEIDEQFIDLSGIGVAEPLPTISISTTELAFGECNIDTYSTEQTFTVSGENLTENLDITSSDNFEISLSTEIDFANSLTISHIAGTIEETTVYVRFLPTESQNYTGTISINSIEIDEQFIDLSGIGVLVPSPVISVLPSELNFENTGINQISEEQNYTISGENLTDNIEITAPEGFKISKTSANNFTNVITLYQIGGNIDETTIYVRFEPSQIQAYSDFIINSSEGTENVNVTVTGEGTNPTYSATFYFSDGVSPIENVELTLGTFIDFSDSNGRVKIEDLENGEYNWTANKEGYSQANGTIMIENANLTEYIDLFATNINELNPSISIYPNPSDGIFKIIIDKHYIVDIYDVTGKSILSQNIDKSNNTIDLSSQKAGVYFIQLIGETVTTLQVIVK